MDWNGGLSWTRLADMEEPGILVHRCSASALPFLGHPGD